jgi:hypothetical protein
MIEKKKTNWNRVILTIFEYSVLIGLAYLVNQMGCNSPNFGPPVR